MKLPPAPLRAGKAGRAAARSFLNSPTQREVVPDAHDPSKERALAAEIAKVFEWGHPRMDTSEVLYMKATQIKDIVAKGDFKELELTKGIARLNIDQLKVLCKCGMDAWERERLRGRGFALDPLHLVKTAADFATKATKEQIFITLRRSI